MPPIEKLWRALTHGDAFPTCDFASGLSGLPAQVLAEIPPSSLANLGAGTGAGNVVAGANYCRPDLLYISAQDQGQLMCAASGAINVTLNGSLYTRVWWGIGLTRKTISEYYGAGSTQVPYDPTQVGAQYLQKLQQPSSSLDNNH